MKETELLAPVGSFDTFSAAMDAGADAVYVGAPGFNARNPSRELQLDEIGAMTAHCHSLGKKLYVAANSIVLQRELETVVGVLAAFQALAIDGLIVQDLGLLRLVRTYFPEIPLHGSTLMTIHNSDGVRFFGQRGCQRVVVARELTLDELELIAARAGDVELEVFIHGAMCFSYSGLCLFSSYLGGKSSIRGRCVQPCRRAYSSAQSRSRSGGNIKTRYLFSMNDLSGLEAVPRLQRMGIASLKIEGRLRTPSYVQTVVEAYRLVLDAQDKEDALSRAKTRVKAAMSRTTTSAYFFSPQPQKVISPHHSGNMGIHLGRFSTVKTRAEDAICRFVCKAQVGLGDRLRLQVEPSGGRHAFRLRSLFVQGEPRSQALPGEKISLCLPLELIVPPGGFVDVYLVDRDIQPGSAKLRIPAAEIAQSLLENQRQFQEKVRQVMRECGLLRADAGRDKREVLPRSDPRRPRKKLGVEWWLKTDSIKILSAGAGLRPDRIVLPFEKQLLAQAGLLKRQLGKRIRSVVWALPPVIMEAERARVHKQIQLLLRSGFYCFQIAHVSQSSLFVGKKVRLFADYTLNVYNSQAFCELLDLGVKAVQAGIEMDRTALYNFCRDILADTKASQTPLGVYVYGTPALYTSRIAAKHFSYGQQILSPKKEPYVICKKDGYTQTFPEQPLSLLPYVAELKEMGVRYVLVDICGQVGKRGVQQLENRLLNNGRYPKLSTFNYLGNLE
ncbi:MAG: hypothetical protein CSA20_04210 [Deltaproteobacteria bacterium]|nr:MAG: hypothetical protein CSA20_04210 [Deltaproteobacteria bacterium]